MDGRRHFFFLLLLSIVASPVLFLELDSLPFQQWDEGRILINTYEMLDRENYIAATFGGQPEFWNTKPGLLHWLQIGSIKVFGFNEFGARLPSALAALLTCMIVHFWMNTTNKSYVVSFLVIVVLLSSSGYVGLHASLTADYDALLGLYTTLSAFTFYLSVEKSFKWLIPFGLFLSLAALTKGVAGLLFVPGYIFYLFYRMKFRQILLSPYLYVALAIFIVSIGSYYLTRDSLQPGYLNAVFNNELGGRFGGVIEEHQGPFYYYIGVLSKNVSIIWLVILAPGAVIVLRNGDLIHKNLMIYCLGVTGLFTVVIGFAGTKLDWYYLPAYPIISIMIGTVTSHVLKISRNYKFASRNKNTVQVAVGILALTFYVSSIVKVKEYNRTLNANTYGASRYLQHCLHNDVTISNVDVVWSGYDAHVRIYVLLLQDKGNEIGIVSPESLKAGHTLIVSQGSVHEYLRSNYEYQEIVIDAQTSLYKLAGDE